MSYDFYNFLHFLLQARKNKEWLESRERAKNSWMKRFDILRKTGKQEK